ncbi:MAG TPA: phospholipase D-like domain-containing protein [Blastocatellia bacterium]|nr:phospholipase D-like domain-containing protein [Blastocatellia bacterium]
MEIKQDAAEFYSALMDDMKAARHSIHLQYFIWAVDSFTENFKDILMAKAKEGVEVRLLYDPVGSQAKMRRAYVRKMREAGISMAPTSPLYRLHTISYRNHRKITVIDGIIGYTGGMNIGKEHLDGGEGFTSWRDTQVRIVGEGAAVLQAVFMVDWYNAVRENLFSAEYFPTDTSDIGDAISSHGPGDDDVPVQILTSGPDSQWAAIRQLYSFLIVGAQRHVFMQSLYFILDASIAEALISAALSGADVKVRRRHCPQRGPTAVAQPSPAGWDLNHTVRKAGRAHHNLAARAHPAALPQSSGSIRIEAARWRTVYCGANASVSLKKCL